MMRKMLGALVSLTAGAGLLGLAAPATASTRPASGPACGYVAVIKGIDSTRIHEKASLDGKVDGILYPGQRLPSPAVRQNGQDLCEVTGGSYPTEGAAVHQCFGARTDNFWLPVQFMGRTDYVAGCYTYWPQ